MKLYRNLKPDETLQAGDERMSGNGGWKPAEAVWIGQPVPEDLMGCFRRPVDLPTLQRVTPEAMAELEARGGYVTFFRHSRSVRCVYSPSQDRKSTRLNSSH